MSYSLQSLTKNAEGVREPLAGRQVMDFVQTGRGDLSDWAELMEAVKALCPVWPVAENGNAKAHRL